MLRGVPEEPVRFPSPKGRTRARQLAAVPDLRGFGFIEFLFFIAILVVAYVYVWRKGALDWQ